MKTSWKRPSPRTETGRVASMVPRVNSLSAIKIDKRRGWFPFLNSGAKSN
jgi:hypothetical protein